MKYKFYVDNLKISKISLANALNLFYKLLIISAIIMPFISEEIYSILYKKFRNVKSIHIENWPAVYKNIPKDLIEIGKIGIDIIKILRMNKSKLQIPLNQGISKVIILSDKLNLEKIKYLVNDIKNTIRIEHLELIEKSMEISFKEQPILTEIIEELNLTIYLFK
ncbi:MAG: class I tRNA ligase family protein [Candidatus Thorarchaeota archaeon]